MATKDLFALIREGDYDKIKEYVQNLRDLTAIENALNLDPTLVGPGNIVRRFRLSKMIMKMSSEYFIFYAV